MFAEEMLIGTPHREDQSREVKGAATSSGYSKEPERFLLFSAAPKCIHASPDLLILFFKPPLGWDYLFAYAVTSQKNHYS